VSTQKIQSIRGVKDILPSEMPSWHLLEATARHLLETSGYAEIKIPVFEATELFARSLGAATDVVEKEMYTFPDRDGKSLTLRPEGTASVMRAYIEHSLWADAPLTKLYYLGPMFRHERPQAGRFRQFHQIGAEAVGSMSPLLDAEQLVLLDRLFRALDVTPTTLLLNSLGCPLCRPRYREALKAFLAPRLDQLCEACRRRYDTNPLRILDCKREECRTATKDAPAITAYLGPECVQHFEAVKTALDDVGLAYRIEPRLVRGLDYYTKTAFEFTAEGLGAQNTIAAGGRYDGLVEALGGPSTPGVGFALGIERVVALLKQGNAAPRTPGVFIATLGEAAGRRLAPLLTALRDAGIRTETDYDRGSLKSQLRKADKLGARYTVILGDDEIARAQAVVRDMETKAQQEVALGELLAYLTAQVSPR
jgi:histidyl-tRNA synthetase